MLTLKTQIFSKSITLKIFKGIDISVNVFIEMARCGKLNDKWLFRFNMDDKNDLSAYIQGLLDANILPTAIVCTTDMIPIQLFPLLTAADPPQIGRAAVELITKQLDKSNQAENLGYRLNPERVLVANNLIIRESTAECSR